MSSNDITVSKEFLEVCVNELKRTSLTSLPIKMRFAEEMGFASVDEVHNWMSATRGMFCAMVNDYSKQYLSV